MAEVTASMVKELRERTQAGMSDCKAALVEAGGDMEKAVEIILKKGLAKSAKRAGAAATEGEVRAAIDGGKKAAVLVEVNSQTDFVARNDDFQKFVETVSQVALGTAQGEDLGQKPYPGSDKTVEAFRQALSGTIGENIQVRRWERFDLQGTGFLTSYVHMGGKIGVLVEIGTETKEVAENAGVRQFGDDVAMQIAAMTPLWVEKTQVPADAIAKQVEIFQGQLKEEGKPEAAWPKIIEGKKVKWFTEVCLLDQESCMTPGSSIDKLRDEAAKAAGGMVTIRRFVRFERGEGVAKKSDDFAAEVAKMAGALRALASLAVSVDLDDEREYRAIHGLPEAAASGSSVVWDVALPRLLAWAKDVGVPLTLFVIARDMARVGAPRSLREAVAEGHELGNHTLDHPYDLTTLSPSEQRRQVEVAQDVVTRAAGVAPLGFRAPGYLTSPSLLEIVRDVGLRYDASAFPCPAYALAKNGIRVAKAIARRPSRSLATRWADTMTPRQPHVLPGGLLEIPMAVTRRLRLPVIGTTLTTAPEALSTRLLRGLHGDRVVSLELHAFDALDRHDGLAELAGHQPDLRVPWGVKLRRLAAAVHSLAIAGFVGARLSEVRA